MNSILAAKTDIILAREWNKEHPVGEVFTGCWPQLHASGAHGSGQQGIHHRYNVFWSGVSILQSKETEYRDRLRIGDKVIDAAGRTCNDLDEIENLDIIYSTRCMRGNWHRFKWDDTRPIPMFWINRAARQYTCLGFYRIYDYDVNEHVYYMTRL